MHAVAGVTYVPGAELRGHDLRTATSPYFSLFMAVRDAAGAERSGTPEPWCVAIRAHLKRRDYEVLAPLATAQRTLAPDAILPFPEPPGQTLKEDLEQVVAAEDRLVRDIQLCLELGPTGDWRRAERDPRRWVRDFALAIARAWNGFRPVWQQAQARLAAEAERVAAATERAAQLDVVSALLPHGRLADGRWEIDRCDAARVPARVADAGLTLLPLIAGPRASIVDDSGPGLRHVGYPLRAGTPDAESGPASLDALLGAQRARILRVLERPRTNNELAAALEAVPSVATRHVSVLEEAGLVSRRRAGRAVVLRRTPRGEALLALYDDA
jgi:DNA-binding transcriptional ArsR family regulator